MNVKLNNQHGFGLIQAMVISAVVGTSSVVMLQKFQNHLKETRTDSQSYNISSIENNVRKILSRKETCDDNFKGLLTDGSADVSQIVGETGDIFYQEGNTYNKNVRLIDIRLGGPAAADNVPMTSGTFPVATILFLDFEKTGDFFGSKKISKEVYLGRYPAGVGPIGSCAALNSSRDERLTKNHDAIWERVGSPTIDGTNAIIHKHTNPNIDTRLGVNVSSPQGTAHINHPSDQTQVLISSVSGNSRISFSDDNGDPSNDAWYLKRDGVNNRFSLGLNDGGTDRDNLVIDNNTNRVGLGTTSPDARGLSIHQSNTQGQFWVAGEGDGASWSRLSLSNTQNDRNWKLQHAKLFGQLDILRNDKHMMSLIEGDVPTGEVASLHLNHIRGNAENHLRTVLWIKKKNEDSVFIAHPFDLKDNTGIELVSTNPNAHIDFLGGGTDGRIRWVNNVGLSFDANGNGNIDAIIHSGGEFSIGGSDTSRKVVVLDQNNPPYGRVLVEAFAPTSDARLKKNITSFNSGVGELMALQAYTYNWKSQKVKNKKTLKKKEIGLMAQDVEKVFPQIVHKDNSGFKSISYFSMVPPLANAIQDQQMQIEELQRKLLKLKELRRGLKSEVK